MKKIYCNKILIPIIVCSIFIIIDTIMISLIVSLDDTKLLTSLLIILGIVNIVFIPLISYLFIRKYSSYILINENYLEYINKKDDFKISLDNIYKLSYRRNPKGDFKELSIILLDQRIIKLVLTKKVIKRIAHLTNKELMFDDYTKIERFKLWILDLFKKMKEHLKEILFTITGLMLTILFFIIFLNNKENNILTMSLCIISFIYSSIQFYFVYFVDKNYGLIMRIFLSIFASILIGIIFFIILCIGGALIKDLVVINVLIYSVLLLPSFIVVVVILMLILAGLSYV